MIVLITGPSFVGKTVLAQKMLEKYKYPYLSTDQLKMGLIRSDNTNLTPTMMKNLRNIYGQLLRESLKLLSKIIRI